jgi:AhpD family alkylhydroperoxidase
MSTSPALAEAYLALWDIFQRKTDLTDAEQHVVVLTVSRFHECHYCMAAHSMTAGMAEVDRDVVVGLGHKVLSNDTGHLTDTPVDKPMQANAWQVPA